MNNEKVAVWELKIPGMGSFLLMYRELTDTEEIEEFLKNAKVVQDDTLSSIRELFETDEITINVTPDKLMIYKEILIESVWVSNNTIRPYTYKWSRGGLAVLEGYSRNDDAQAQMRENFIKLFKS